MAVPRRVTLTIPGLDEAEARSLGRALKKDDRTVSVAHTTPSPLLPIATVTMTVRAARPHTAGQRAMNTVHAVLRKRDPDAPPPTYSVE